MKNFIKGHVDQFLRNFSWYMDYQERKILKDLEWWEAYQAEHPEEFAV